MFTVQGLSIAFGKNKAVRDLSLTINRGDRIGLVGESGCGKSITALSLLGMVPDGATVSGSMKVEGEEMIGAREAAWRRHRARTVSMVFQEPLSALNPVKRVGDIIAEPLLVHRGLSAKAARARVLELLHEVGMPEPEARLGLYPHQLSGGQRQRVLIATALSCDPSLLVADEPTTALDASVAARILKLLGDLADKRGMALLFISHDLAAVSRVTREMVVMYGGDIVERGPTAAILADPRHPYTKGLVAARPRPRKPGEPRARLASIRGTVPALADLPAGCRFSGRCPIEIAACATTRPALDQQGIGRFAACLRLDQAESEARSQLPMLEPA
jgi:peptide/nickel transport system ATP-binding protein